MAGLSSISTGFGAGGAKKPRMWRPSGDLRPQGVNDGLLLESGFQPAPRASAIPDVLLC